MGNFVKNNSIRISMHPVQFVLLNSPSSLVVQAAIRDLEYHVSLLNLMGLDITHKVQIHVGGVYGDKSMALQRFVNVYKTLPSSTTKRLVIENDERLWNLKECLDIHKRTNILVLFNTLHHECNNSGEPLRESLLSAGKTWSNNDGLQMIDYSSQYSAKRLDAHFQAFLKNIAGIDYDIMLEIKDKEGSAQKAFLYI